MSRTRYRTQQLEPELRASPVHWSDQSDSGTDGDQEEADEMDGRPPQAAETQEYEAEDQEAYKGYDLRRGRCVNRYRETSRSPVLSRRPIKQPAAVTKEHRGHRESSETCHTEEYISKLQPEHGNIYRQPYGQEKTIQKSLVQAEDDLFSKKHLILVVVLITAILILLHLFVSSKENSESSKENIHTSQDMTAAVETALSKFENIPGDVVFQFSAGIRSVVESDPNKPSIFVLLHNNTGVGPFCLAKAIGNVAMKYLESDEKDPLILKPDELLKSENISEDYGWVIENYKPRIEKHRSVIITDLQKFPGRVAMAFHFLCDIYSPAVPKSLFLFTLRVSDVYRDKKEVEQAEKAMHEIWRSEVDDDQRQALITRLTEDIISLPQNILHNEPCP